MLKVGVIGINDMEAGDEPVPPINRWRIKSSAGAKRKRR
jgi:hypothetical protein